MIAYIFKVNSITYTINYMELYDIWVKGEIYQYDSKYDITPGDSLESYVSMFQHYYETEPLLLLEYKPHG